MDGINVFANSKGLPGIYMGIGMNYGQVIACELGVGYLPRTDRGRRRGQHGVAPRRVLPARAGADERRPVSPAENDVVLGHVNEMHFKGKAQSTTVYEVLGRHGTRPRRLAGARQPQGASRRCGHAGQLTTRSRTTSSTELRCRRNSSTSHCTACACFSAQRQDYLDDIRIMVPFSPADSGEIYGKVLACRPSRRRVVT